LGKLFSTMFLMLLLICAFDIQHVWAGGTIYIRADGTIDPQTAPIQRADNTYIFTNNIDGSIVVERDNIVIDGAGHTLEGTGDEIGIYLSGRRNVTIRNMRIRNFRYGIYLDYSYYCKIYGNSIIGMGFNYVFFVYRSYGIKLYYSSENIIYGNNITKSNYGIYLDHSSDNRFYHNNLIGNEKQVYTYMSINAWDNGSEGNYWSDYKGNDTNGDGIGDTPYIIDKGIQDNHPLMSPWTISREKQAPGGTKSAGSQPTPSPSGSQPTSYLPAADPYLVILLIILASCPALMYLGYKAAVNFRLSRSESNRRKLCQELCGFTNSLWEEICKNNSETVEVKISPGMRDCLRKIKVNEPSGGLRIGKMKIELSNISDKEFLKSLTDWIIQNCDGDNECKRMAEELRQKV